MWTFSQFPVSLFSITEAKTVLMASKDTFLFLNPLWVSQNTNTSSLAPEYVNSLDQSEKSLKDFSLKLTPGLWVESSGEVSELNMKLVSVA